MCWSGWRCLLGSSTAYMLQLSGRRALRISASSQILAFCAATAISQRHPFSVVGFFTYNGLPVEFHLILKNNEIALCRLLNLRSDYINKLRLNCPYLLGSNRTKMNEHELTHMHAYTHTNTKPEFVINETGVQQKRSNLVEMTLPKQFFGSINI